MAKEAENTSAFGELKMAIRAKQPGRLYFFYGEETFLLQYYLEQLKKILIDPLTESFNYHKLTNETFHMQEFADCVENLPMMAEHTFVVVEDVDPFKLPESDREKMVSVLSDIPDYCCVVFTYLTVAWNPDKRMVNLWGAVRKDGTAVAFAKQSQKDLSAWIQRHFAAYYKTISGELCAYLIDITGGTMTALAGEISKIAAFSASDTVCKADIDAVTEPVLDAVVFQMTNLMSDGNYGGALQELGKLMKMQQEPVLILGAIGAHFRKLAAARILSDHGKGSSDLMRLYTMGDYAARKTMAAATRFSPRFYRRAAELVLQTDVHMKTSYGDSQRLLELLILELAQEARND